MKKTQLCLIIAAIATLGLAGCETLKADLDKGFTDLKTAFDSPQEKAPESAQTEAPVVVANQAACPEVRIVDDLNQVHQFKNNAAPKDSESVSSVRMTNIKDYCSIVKNNVAVDMTVAFDGTLGPKARVKPTDKPNFAYPYFVAITNAQGSIIAKEVFAVTMSYEAGKDQETRTEQIRQVIPTGAGNPGSYRVLIGFQLNDQELAYNRALSVDPAKIEPAAGTP